MTGSTPRILTIDDEYMVRRTIADFLEDIGYDVLEAENGRHGLEIFHTEKPDAVLVDLRMPEVDGLDVLKNVTQTSDETPIIVVSGTGVLHDAIEALRRGAWDYVTKPIEDMAILEHALEKALERARLIKENRRHEEHLRMEVRSRTYELKQAVDRLEEEVAVRKKTEEELTTSLKEKEILLKEVHHRVKNNLQIISSLLSLQSHHVDDARVLELLTETRSRISTMALVHKELYQTGDFTNVNFHQYLEKLVVKLVQIFGGERDISPTLEIADMSVPIDMAIPCGLLVNELVTNVLKHAFRGRDSGSLRISLGRENGMIVLLVEDNGVGFPEALDVTKSETLGLQLVVGLSEQLKGSVRVERDNGTRFCITFPAPE